MNNPCAHVRCEVTASVHNHCQREVGNAPTQPPVQRPTLRSITGIMKAHGSIDLYKSTVIHGLSQQYCIQGFGRLQSAQARAGLTLRGGRGAAGLGRQTNTEGAPGPKKDINFRCFYTHTRARTRQTAAAFVHALKTVLAKSRRDCRYCDTSEYLAGTKSPCKHKQSTSSASAQIVVGRREREREQRSRSRERTTESSWGGSGQPAQTHGLAAHFLRARQHPMLCAYTMRRGWRNHDT